MLQLMHEDCSYTYPPLSIARYYYTAEYLTGFEPLRTFTPVTDLFTQTPSQLLWEASSHMLQLTREDCSYTYPPVSIASLYYIRTDRYRCVVSSVQLMTGLECGHKFCMQCWTEYLTTKIMDEGMGQVGVSFIYACFTQPY